MWTLLFLASALPTALLLQGCGDSSDASSTSSTTTTTTTTTPKPKPSAGSPEDKLLSDFHGDVGVTFTKLTHTTWQKGPGKGGFVGQDSAVFFKNWNGNQMVHQTMQAMTIGNSRKWVWPFHGASFGYASWALVFSLREEDDFWKYFETHDACSGRGSPLMAQCGDCRAACCGQQVGSGLAGDTLSYAQWTEDKEAILAKTGDPIVCPPIGNGGTGRENPGKHGWNEFAVNGLSFDALVGVMKDHTGEGGQAPIGETPPSEQEACKFLAMINNERKVKKESPWPTFTYQVQSNSSSLKLDGYLNCEAYTAVVV